MYKLAKLISYLVFRWKLGWRDGHAPKFDGTIHKLFSGKEIRISKDQMLDIKTAATGNQPLISAIKKTREIFAIDLRDSKELVEDLGDASILPECCSRRRPRLSWAQN